MLSHSPMMQNALSPLLMMLACLMPGQLRSTAMCAARNSSSRPGFTVRWETVKEGVEYRVHVKASDIGTPALGVFRIKTDCKYPRFANPVAFGHVRKP